MRHIHELDRFAVELSHIAPNAHLVLKQWSVSKAMLVDVKEIQLQCNFQRRYARWMYFRVRQPHCVLDKTRTLAYLQHRDCGSRVSLRLSEKLEKLILFRKPFCILHYSFEVSC